MSVARKGRRILADAGIPAEKRVNQLSDDEILRIARGEIPPG